MPSLDELDYERNQMDEMDALDTQRAIEEESRQYGDILQGDFEVPNMLVI